MVTPNSVGNSTQYGIDDINSANVGPPVEINRLKPNVIVNINDLLNKNKDPFRMNVPILQQMTEEDQRSMGS